LSPELTAALRDETPSAPASLRDRVAMIAITPPPPRRTFTFRRALLWTAPATALAALAVAVVVGVFTSANPSAPTAEPRSEQRAVQNLDRKFAAPLPQQQSRAVTTAGAKGGPAPSRRRAQQVQASLRLLVDDPDDLSAATQSALRTTRRLGGYVVAVDYGTPEATEGRATLRVRVPVSRVQAAVVDFSNLGRILGQQTRITDLQQRLTRSLASSGARRATRREPRSSAASASR